MIEGNGTQLKLGQHDARLDNVEDSLSRLHEKVDELLAAEHKRTGAWKTIALLGTISGGISALVVSYLGLGR